MFNKAAINWQNDFIKLYRSLKEERPLSISEIRLLKFFETYMPYLCTKVQLKEIDNQKLNAPADSAAAAKQTSKLLAEFEKETNVLKPNPPPEGHS